ncbi:hypothetical protein ISI01_31345 [Burkholderia pseudomallei]|nr:hypothetical protein [Burkholderia pseudomallei]
MSKDTQFFDVFKRYLLLGIHTSAPARIERYNGKTADIQLLFKQAFEDGTTESYGPIIEVPILSQKYKENNEIVIKTPYYEKGDLVMVSFCERAIDELQKQPFDPVFHRTHSVQDAVIIGYWGP